MKRIASALWLVLSLFPFCPLYAFTWPVANLKPQQFPQPSVAVAYGEGLVDSSSKRYFHGAIDIPFECTEGTPACGRVVLATNCYHVHAWVERTGQVEVVRDAAQASPVLYVYRHIYILAWPPPDSFVEGDLLGQVWHNYGTWAGGYADHLHFGIVDFFLDSLYHPVDIPVDNPLLQTDTCQACKDPGGSNPFEILGTVLDNMAFSRSHHTLLASVPLLSA
jgi:hypothetical protein